MTTSSRSRALSVAGIALAVVLAGTAATHFAADSGANEKKRPAGTAGGSRVDRGRGRAKHARDLARHRERRRLLDRRNQGARRRADRRGQFPPGSGGCARATCCSGSMRGRSKRRCARHEANLRARQGKPRPGALAGAALPRSARQSTSSRRRPTRRSAPPPKRPRRSLKASQAAVETARLNLQYCTIRSPIDGYVGRIMLQLGNLVKANDTNALVVINQVKPIYATFAVPEQRLSEIRRHMADGPLEVDGAAAPTRAARRLRPAAWYSSTTRSTSAPERSNCAPSSKTATSRCGRGSSST